MHEILHHLERVRGRRASVAIAVVSIALVALIALVDAALNPQIGMVLAYLIPVGLAAYFAPVPVSRLVCAAAAIASFLAVSASGVEHYDAGWILVWNVVVRLVIFVLFSELVHRLRSALEREQLLARTDPLTGVPNSRAFDELCEVELRRLGRFGHAFSVALVDLDDFKRVNDNRGHAAGDEVLRAVTDSLGRSLRRTDTVARLGGDEFVVLLPGSDAEDASGVARHLVEAVRVARGEDGIGASIGIVTVRGGSESVDSVLLLADHLLYEAKTRGKGQVAQRVVGDASEPGMVEAGG